MTRDIYFNATQLAKELYPNKKIEPRIWLRKSSTLKLLQDLAVKLNISVDNLYSCIRGGNKQGTYIRNELKEFFVNWLNGGIEPEYKRDELLFKNMLEETLKDICDIKFQFNIDNYRLDFFIEKYNLVIEYDEKYHKEPKIQNKDDVKTLSLLTKYNYSIIRVNQGEELQGINQIIKFIMGVK